MENLNFGITMLIVGMGGTLITLYALTWVLRGLTHFFPAKTGETDKKN
jgi:Na+-transporting methylmalonyl-CoA/oxaloacetate decarboxylase gamma subunit